MIQFETLNHPLQNSPHQKIIDQIKNHPFSGWLDLPFQPEKNIAHVKALGQQIQKNSQYLICIGIGGSYLGHKAIIDALNPEQNLSSTKILYAGHNLSSHEIKIIKKTIKNADFSINIISKSGTTLEPALAFRFFKQLLYQKYGQKANRRIYATTDKARGALFAEAKTNHYHRLIIPDNVGGRYSVLSPVGLLPLTVAGIDIFSLLNGAKLATNQNSNSYKSAINYAFTRQSLYQSGHETEILATFEPRLKNFAEWWKQLFGESEGKNLGGIFPASVIYTTDLHSLGQYLQQGRRNIFETFLSIKDPDLKLEIPFDHNNLDGLNYLSGQTFAHINQQAESATIKAHQDGSIPINKISIPNLSEASLGELIFFFELTCAISATIQSIDPFDQPGVEAYKLEMKKLLG